ncbi:hypothetical protein BDB00DRAFT_866326 [Zychaea mexicana]|uniref:uncharacterized protein n=1 Tax=Zychaea mexicana TaxID=64656 RepID=UPI0022FE2077|nr:uncharacterized protein BDB00DRAFT_866326 [Zychaea mexicana]KAI9499447.1 hypothetical protein BDB00DRAFT_866326 [Zychaea mexicana]
MVYAHKTAVIHSNRTLVHETLTDRILHLVNVFIQDCNLKPDDSVALLCESTLASPKTHFAAPATGAILVPMNIQLLGSEIEYIVNHSGVSDFVSNVSSNVVKKLKGYIQVANTHEVRVFDKETSNDVTPSGELIGEVCFSGSCIMLGYYNNPQETAKVLKDGVFWSGDMAGRYLYGAIKIVDRSKDLIISKR